MYIALLDRLIQWQCIGFVRRSGRCTCLPNWTGIFPPSSQPTLWITSWRWVLSFHGYSLVMKSLLLMNYVHFRLRFCSSFIIIGSNRNLISCSPISLECCQAQNWLGGGLCDEVAHHVPHNPELCAPLALQTTPECPRRRLCPPQPPVSVNLHADPSPAPRHVLLALLPLQQHIFAGVIVHLDSGLLKEVAVPNDRLSDRPGLWWFQFRFLPRPCDSPSLRRWETRAEDFLRW